MRIPNRPKTGGPVGIYPAYEGDHRGAYTFIVGGEVGRAESPPEGLTAHTAPAGSCLVFDASGTPPASVQTAWRRVWAFFGPGCSSRRAFTTDLEVYEGPDRVTLYIAVSPQAGARAGG